MSQSLIESELLLIAQDRLMRTYFQQTPTLQVAKDLIGCFLWSKRSDGLVKAIKIVETEAYIGVDDRGCHAFGGRRTLRNEAMYATGGIFYVYLCYGIHPLLNIVTANEGLPEAVLIRAGVPVVGINDMSLNSPKLKIHKLASGPGRLTKALNVSICDNFESIEGERLWITKSDMSIPKKVIEKPRVGIEYAKDHALFPWRFYLEDCSSVSVL
jgi:DNA-3-methyladenine glycosylase